MNILMQLDQATWVSQKRAISKVSKISSLLLYNTALGRRNSTKLLQREYNRVNSFYVIKNKQTKSE